MSQADAVVVGGGYYGIQIARAFLVRHPGAKVLLVEQASALMSRASLNNQGRVHHGYHYPRSWTTARGSRENFSRFIGEHTSCILGNTRSVYAVARHNSKVNVRQFLRFCRQLGAPAVPAPLSISRLFRDDVIEGVFVVDEPILDVGRFAEHVRASAHDAGLEIRLSCELTAMNAEAGGAVRLILTTAAESSEVVTSRVFLCTYAALGRWLPQSEASGLLKHELAEMSIVKSPDELRDLAVTVVDGPFFSIVPYGTAGEHCLTHVRYTPHRTLEFPPNGESYRLDPHQLPASQADRMIRAASRQLPLLAKCEPQRSVFEIKAVLQRHEGDDGRPILYLENSPFAGVTSILGGKLDNVFDVLARMEQSLGSRS